jgi:hypothetical protein
LGRKSEKSMKSYRELVCYLAVITTSTTNFAFGGYADVTVSLVGNDGNGEIFRAVAQAENPAVPSVLNFNSNVVLQPFVLYTLTVNGRVQSQIFSPSSAAYRTAIDLSATLGSGATLPTTSTSYLGVESRQVSGQPDDSKGEEFLTIPFTKSFSTSASGTLSRSDASGTYSLTAIGQTLHLVGGITTHSFVPPNGYGWNYGYGIFSTYMNFHVTQPTTLSLEGTVSAVGQGVSQQFPILPASPLTSTSPVATFINVTGGSVGTGTHSGEMTGGWFDPPMADGYSFAMTGGSLFTDILNFPTGIDGDGAFHVWVGATNLGTFEVGERVNFVELLGAGVSSFRVTGINPSVDGGNSEAFPIQLAFNTTTADFTMTPLFLPGQSYLTNVQITPSVVGQPPKFSGILVAAPPAGIARLQASIDLGITDPWTEIANSILDGTGVVTFTNVEDNRAHAIGTKKDFFRVVTESPEEP